jgi:hypothetical protein
VSTANNVVISAYPITNSGGGFDKWISSTPGTPDSNPNNLDFNAGTDSYALAFYHESCSAGYQWSSNGAISQCSATPTETNRCGGTAVLTGPVGTSCGSNCERWACSGPNSVKCEQGPTNACGGCINIPTPLGAGPQPGERCTCPNGKSGRFYCTTSKMLNCDCTP